MRKLIFLFSLLAFVSCKTPGGDDDDGPRPEPIPEPTPSPSPGPNPGPKALKLDAPKWLKIKAGAEVALQVLPRPDESYVWSTGQTGPVVWVKPAATSAYTVTAVHKDGRSITAVINVIVEP